VTDARALSPEAIRSVLAEITCPGTKVDIVKINLVGDVRVDGDSVSVEIVRTSEKPETIAAVKELVEKKLAGMPGVGSTAVRVTEPEAPAPKAAKPAPDPWAERCSLAGVKKIVAVASGKGGVGKSTVAVNLALALKQKGYRVGLLDADIYGPSLPTMLGTEEPPQAISDTAILPVESHGLQVISMGLLVPPGQAVVWRGPMVMAAIRQFLKDVQWNDLDYLVVDMPPGTGDAQLTLVQQVPVDGVVMVTTPQELALADVRRGIQMFGHVSVSVLGVVENMSFFLCPDNGKRYEIFGSGGGAAVAEQFGVPLLGQIPIEPSVRAGGDSGVPAVETGEGAACAAFLDLAGKVEDALENRD